MVRAIFVSGSFQNADLFIVFLRAGMEGEIGNVFDGVGGFQTFEILLGLSQFVDVFPEGLGELVYRVFGHVGAGEHDHFNGRSLDVGFLIRIGTFGNSVGGVPRIFFLQRLQQSVVDVPEVSAGDTAEAGAPDMIHAPSTLPF